MCSYVVKVEPRFSRWLIDGWVGMLFMATPGLHLADVVTTNSVFIVVTHSHRSLSVDMDIQYLCNAIDWTRQ